MPSFPGAYYFPIPFDAKPSEESIITHNDMARLKPGDRVDCRVKSGIIVSPYRDYEETVTLEIIGVDKHGYYLYVPQYYSLKASETLESYDAKKLNIDKKFVGEEIIYIRDNVICKVESLDGCKCAKCGEFYHMAQPNQDDGTLICWSCRANPYR